MNKSLILKAYAKINLALDITGLMENGYHEISTVFQSISLYDTVSVSLNNSGNITVLSDSPEIPSGEKNIAFKAVRKFSEYLKNNKIGADIKISKNIPSQAGLGGGSADAGAVIKALDILTQSQLSDKQLFSVGSSVGADVPFCIKGGTAYATGIGENLLFLPAVPDYFNCSLCIAKGSDGISTAQAYGKYDSMQNIIHSDSKYVADCLKNKDFPAILNKCGNIFEQLTDSEDIKFIKNSMLENNASLSLLSGSGSAVFGIFQNTEDAEKCTEFLKEKNFFAKVCTLKKYGSEII